MAASHSESRSSARRMRLVEPYQTRPPGSSRTPPSLTTSARANMSRRRESDERTSTGRRTSTRGTVRALARPGPVTIVIVANEDELDPVSRPSPSRMHAFGRDSLEGDIHGFDVQSAGGRLDPRRVRHAGPGAWRLAHAADV